MNSMRSRLWIALAVAAMAMAARGAACWKFADNLSDDRDVYLAIAKGVHEGRGFSVPGTAVPTAFRPPLYPLLLAPISGDDQRLARGLLHSILGGVAAACVVWLVATAGLSPWRQFVAGTIVAIDPLLTYYATLPMTETLAAALTAGLLATAAAACKSNSRTAQRRFSVLAGGLFGLCVLCRPTYWVFSLCVVAFGLWQMGRGAPPPALREIPSRRSDWILSSMVCLVVVLPWPIRNVMVLGRPILMTTHGGYTLLLGNNSAYYREVVDQPWGTIWDGSHGPGQEVWAAEMNSEMDAAGITGEVARDQWLRDRAIATIREEPATFLYACLRRFLSFWNVRPHGDSQTGVPQFVRVVVATYYALLWAALLLGGWRALRRGGCAVELSTLMIVAFVGAHLVYWTDARMRAPIVPAIALLAAGSAIRNPSKFHEREGIVVESTP